MRISKEGCGAAAPTSPAPPKQAAEAGVRQWQYCFTHHAWRGRVMGQEEEGQMRGVSQATCPLPPWWLHWQDSEAVEAKEWPTPTGTGCTLMFPFRAGSSLRRSPGPKGAGKTGGQGPSELTPRPRALQPLPIHPPYQGYSATWTPVQFSLLSEVMARYSELQGQRPGVQWAIFSLAHPWETEVG